MLFHGSNTTHSSRRWSEVHLHTPFRQTSTGETGNACFSGPYCCCLKRRGCRSLVGKSYQKRASSCLPDNRPSLFSAGLTRRIETGYFNNLIFSSLHSSNKYIKAQLQIVAKKPVFQRVCQITVKQVSCRAQKTWWSVRASMFIISPKK